MVLWVIIAIVFVAWYLQSVDYTWESSAALSYVLNFGQAMSYIFILCIAKHAAWNKSTAVDPMANMDAYAGVAPQQQYGHNANPNGQVYYHQQAPGYNGTSDPFKP